MRIPSRIPCSPMTINRHVAATARDGKARRVRYQRTDRRSPGILAGTDRVVTSNPGDGKFAIASHLGDVGLVIKHQIMGVHSRSRRRWPGGNRPLSQPKAARSSGRGRESGLALEHHDRLAGLIIGRGLSAPDAAYGQDEAHPHPPTNGRCRPRSTPHPDSVGEPIIVNHLPFVGVSTVATSPPIPRPSPPPPPLADQHGCQIHIRCLQFCYCRQPHRRAAPIPLPAHCKPVGRHCRAVARNISSLRRRTHRRIRFDLKATRRHYYTLAPVPRPAP